MKMSVVFFLLVAGASAFIPVFVPQSHLTRSLETIPLKQGTSDEEGIYDDKIGEERIQEVMDKAKLLSKMLSDIDVQTETQLQEEGFPFKTVDSDALKKLPNLKMPQEPQFGAGPQYGVGPQYGAAPRKLKDETAPPPAVARLRDKVSIASYNSPQKSDKNDKITHPPAEIDTGVDPAMTRLCATISGQMYYAKDKSQFQLSDHKNKVDVVMFDDNNKDMVKLGETIPPMVIAVTGNTMIIGWRGSQTLMDWVLDFAFAPLASRSWMHTAPTVRAQGGYCALVENYLSRHEDTILHEIEKHEITELLLTGHSLAGGVAQVAHFFLEGERSAPDSKWPNHKTLKIRCIAFSAPMTTVNVDLSNQASSTFLDSVRPNVVNIVYQSDPVPRAYGNISFILDVLKAALDEIQRENLPIPGIIKWALGLQKRIQVAVGTTITKQKELIEVASNYRHIGKVIYYKNADAEPEVYGDMGYSCRKPEGSTEKDFRDIVYKRSNDIVKDIADSHLFLVTGPGLAYYIDRDKLED